MPLTDDSVADVHIEFDWILQAPLHSGNGISRNGYADRLIRTAYDGSGNPRFDGDSLKGAIRGSAERLARWVDPTIPEEEEGLTTPKHPVLRRIFSGDEYGTYYRFFPPQLDAAAPLFTASSTAIDRKSGVARDDTLRTIEAAAKDLRFHSRIKGYNGRWHNPDSEDRKDLLFLLASILATESIGARKGTGWGRVQLGKDPECVVGDQNLKFQEAIDNLAKLRKHFAPEHDAAA